ncbi:MAG TPA: aldehyde dehydrogenase family protein [Polyangia bacterium]|nr:aldehyde dehydrogenase family protein [Polyangia bacterium]
MQLDERKIQEIVERVVARLGAAQSLTPAEAVARTPPHPQPPAPAPPDKRKGEPRIPPARLGIHPDPDSAVKAARKAFEANEAAPPRMRERWIQAMREVTRAKVKELSDYARDETGLGRAEDKIGKNLLCVDKTPGTEILRPIAFSGDYGLTITERAPYGVIGAITPTTNPTETIINNGVGMVAGGNAVVFNVHPLAARTSAWHVHLLNEAITAAGGPPNLVACVANPTIESAQALMRHPGIRLLVVTGGPGVVKEAMNAGKKVIAAGPGNPPAVVDESADLARAARGIVKGASIDNNIICTAEKEAIVVAQVADKLTQELQNNACYLLNDKQVAALEKVILIENGKHTNKDWVGKDARLLLKQIGVHTNDDYRLAICLVDEQHPFVQHELLMPVLGIVRVPDAVEAIAMAKRVEHGFGHTAVMYSRNIEHMHAMARTINTSIFVKNDCNLAGLGLEGEGYTSFTIASPTGEGLTTAINFTRERRCTLKEYFRFV